MLVIYAYDLAHDLSIQFMLVIFAGQSRHLKGMIFRYININPSRQTLYIYITLLVKPETQMWYIYHTSFGNTVSSSYFFL